MIVPLKMFVTLKNDWFNKRCTLPPSPPPPLCIPLRGNAVCILFIFSERSGIFWIKFCNSDPSFNKNILRFLYLKFKTSDPTHIAITYYFTWFTNCLTWYEFNLRWGYILINEVVQWFYQLDHVTFSENIFWSVNSKLLFYQIYSVQLSTL